MRKLPIIFSIILLVLVFLLHANKTFAQCAGVNYSCASLYCGPVSMTCNYNGSQCVNGGCGTCFCDYCNPPYGEDIQMTVYQGCAGGPTVAPTPAGCGASCSCTGGGVYPLDCTTMCDGGLTCNAGAPPATGVCWASACDAPPPPPPCTPSCSPACGQANGCGGWCGTGSNVWSTCSGGTQTNACVGSRACGVIQARAKSVSTTASTCADVAASTTYIGSVAMSLSPAESPASQTTDGSASYLSWSNAEPQAYTLLSTPPSAYILRLPCWTTGSSSGTGMSAPMAIGDTITWNLGYSLGTPWIQAQGGDVYAASGISSAVSTLATPREFVLSGSGGFPGVTTYGASYDFDPDLVGKGETYVSSPNWLANETYDTTDYYQVFHKRFGAPVDPDIFSDQNAVTQPASRETPYYVVGDMATSGNWAVGDGEMIVFLVDGDLTINGSINITGANNTGFVAFIVNGDITIDPSVGNPLATTTPNLEGVYITSTAGTFHSGSSTSAGNERLVVEGTVVAGNVALERDLDSVGGNPTAPSELFIYNPQLLITMPDAMRDVPIKWEEVAP
jgi:hypothetical protein